MRRELLLFTSPHMFVQYYNLFVLIFLSHHTCDPSRESGSIIHVAWRMAPWPMARGHGVNAMAHGVPINCNNFIFLTPRRVHDRSMIFSNFKNYMVPGYLLGRERRKITRSRREADVTEGVNTSSLSPHQPIEELKKAASFQ